MNKIPLLSRIIIGVILISILSTSLILASNYLIKRQQNEDNIYDYSWTKAICNETQCQDYEIVCKDKKIISQTPLTGAVISIDENWEDPRDEEFRNKLCE